MIYASVLMNTKRIYQLIQKEEAHLELSIMKLHYMRRMQWREKGISSPEWAKDTLKTD